MPIDSVESFLVSMKMEQPYKVAYKRFDKAENVIVRIGAGKLNGWGCAAPDPHVTKEYPREVLKRSLEVLPSLMGKDPFRKAVIMKSLKTETPGLYSLWAAVDMALWDLLGKKANLPLWKILGGYRERICTCVTIGICHPEETLKQAKELLDSGITVIKLKGGDNVLDDIHKVELLRSSFGNKFKLRFDANQGYSTEQALLFLKKTRHLKIELFEQPTNKSRPEELGIITRRSETPIMADESLLSLLDAFHLVKKGWWTL